MSFSEIIFLLDTYRYFFLFPVVVVEGPIITVIAGFLSSLGHLNLFIAYAIIVIGDLAGDAMYYSFGYYGRQGFIDRFGHYFGATPERVQRLEKHFSDHPGKTLIIGKLSQGIGALLLMAAGMAKMPFWKFIWYNLISTIPKSAILILIGFYFGETYNKINTYLDYTALGTIALAVIFIVVYFGIKNISKKYGAETAD